MCVDRFLVAAGDNSGCGGIARSVGGINGRMLRTPHFKYVLYEAGENREMLFDMDNDRLEMTNLSIESKYRPELLRHRELLHQWMSENILDGQYSLRRLIPVR